MKRDFDRMTNAQVRAILRAYATSWLRYCPYLVCFIFTGFCLMRGLDMDSHHIIFFLCGAGLIWVPYLFVCSLYHRFCKWHRRLIYFDAVIGLLMYVETWWGFGRLRIPLNWICFAVGLYLIVRVGWLIHRQQFSPRVRV